MIMLVIVWYMLNTGGYMMVIGWHMLGDTCTCWLLEDKCWLLDDAC